MRHEERAPLSPPSFFSARRVKRLTVRRRLKSRRFLIKKRRSRKSLTFRAGYTLSADNFGHLRAARSDDMLKKKNRRGKGGGRGDKKRRFREGNSERGGRFANRIRERAF